MIRLTKKTTNNKNYKYYIDSFDTDIIYGYESEMAKDCGNKFCYGEVVDKLAEYENINLTPYEIEEMRADAHSLHNENNKLKKELEVYKKTFNRFVEVIYQKELEKLTTGKSIDVLFAQFTLIKEHLLQDIRKELEDD